MKNVCIEYACMESPNVLHAKSQIERERRVGKRERQIGNVFAIVPFAPTALIYQSVLFFS